MRKLATLLTLLCLSVWANAEKVQIDGIWYNLTEQSKTAEVTSANNGTKRYEGEVAVPKWVTYEGVVYRVTSIGDTAFQYCDSLTSITIPNSVVTIGNEAFYLCRILTNVTIPNSVTNIGESAFESCYSLTSITIPNSVTNIGNRAFGCSKLTSMIVEEGNTVYDSRDNCNAIIETATNTLISGCQSTIIPNSVASIGSSAFEHCFNLTSITLPNSVSSIGNSAFKDCLKLTNITISNYVTSIGSSAFYNCSSLTSITIPNSVKSIGNSAFWNCDNLTSITLPNSVTSIGSSAFSSCSSLTSITLPNSVTSIGSSAFSGCNNLTDVYCYAEKVPTTERYAFTNFNIKQATLHVPESSIENYKTTAPWNKFGTIKVLLEDGNSVTYISSTPVLIQTQASAITLTGLSNGTPVSVYSIDGKEVGNGVAANQTATMQTLLQTGDIAIVRIGTKSVKVVMK